MKDPHCTIYVGQYLRQKRESCGLTQSEVATKLGYGSSQFISNFERGISSVPLKSLKVLVQLYSIPVPEIIDVIVQAKKEKLLRILNGEEEPTGDEQ